MISAYHALVRALALLAGALVVLMAAGIAVDVTIRACCTSAIFGLGDMTEYALAAATFLAAPWVLMKEAHVSVDIVTMTLPAKARHRLGQIVNALGATISAVFFWYMANALIIALDRGSMVRGILVVPEWLTLFVPALCCGLLSLGFLLRLRQGTPHRSEPTGL